MKKTKEVLCDAGVLISLTSACLDDLLRFFAENHGVRFIISPSVEEESVGRPIKSDLKKYLFSAIRIKDAIEDGIVVVVNADITSKAQKIMSLANNLFYIGGKPLHLIHYGESELIALSQELGINHILVDERTTRLLIESPFTLKKHLENEFKINVMVNKKNLTELSSEFFSLNPIRTSELVMLAYENGYFKRFEKLQKSAIKSALYKVKYAGCSIGFDEIDEYMRMI
ncbi:hypothetical protein KKF81_00895 [Candidatus Micrarchaeota archaeon]|nr:hypothetical protein [Candidatus Micrarchaeota archaeon]MBU1165476.1 hypothetical protein [Candidatus Micrarchaeota archaeon]MBU1886314.1 hypothetical protein [Candidatus Micrarchaeota archaeon]